MKPLYVILIAAFSALIGTALMKAQDAARIIPTPPTGGHTEASPFPDSPPYSCDVDERKMVCFDVGPGGVRIPGTERNSP